MTRTKPRVDNINGLTPILGNKRNVSKGRTPGYNHLKDLDIAEYTKQLQCEGILIDFPFLMEKRLVFNPYLWRSFGRANYDTNTIEIAEKIKDTTIDFQRNVFIRAASHFIARKLYGITNGDEYEAIVKRYM